MEKVYVGSESCRYRTLMGSGASCTCMNAEVKMASTLPPQGSTCLQSCLGSDSTISRSHLESATTALTCSGLLTF